MEVIHGLRNIRKYKNPVIAIGVFDGVHRAHRRILQAVVRTARRIGGTGVVLTFSPHPQREDSLSSLEHRLRYFKALGIDAGIILDFNRSFAGISADRFVKDVLVGKIGVRSVFVGENFRFGKHAHADTGILETLGRRYGFRVRIFKTICFKGKPVSSTSIRGLIAEGRLSDAKRLLLRPVSVLGKVVRGTSVATKLGFPTANLKPDHEVLPPPGVYAVRALLRSTKPGAVAYIGVKPAFASRFSSLKPHIVEVHIFSFNENIYGEEMEVQFIKKIRDDKRFISSQSLIKQIKKDIVSAKKIFLSHS